MSREQLSAWLDRAEIPLLWLAALAVAGYIVDLAGGWATLGLTSVYSVVSLVVDLVFVADLLLKLASKGLPYVRTPWFLVDLICALPVLSTASASWSMLQGLRFVRMFRMLRALRMLRVLRSLRILKLLAHTGTTNEQRLYHRVLSVAVVAYAVGFILLVAMGRGNPVGTVLSVDGQPVEGDTYVLTVQTDEGPVRFERPIDHLVHAPNQQELWLVLGSLMGMGLILMVTRFQIPAIWSRQMRALLNVALPAQVAEHFMAHPEAYDHDVRMPATVIFCDIKGFTSTVEAIALEDVKVHLEAALDAVVDAHIAQDMIIDKFIGDAVMSFRGGNLVDGDAHDHAYRVVRGALDGLLALEKLGNPFFKEIKVGGASATDALIGTFGTSKRLSYTILGDRVNLAARLEASCNALGVRTLFCDMTRELVGDRGDIVWREVGEVRVQGKEVTTNAFEAFDARDDTDWLDGYHQALEAYRARDAEAALRGFRKVLVGREEDGPSAIYAGRCEVLLASGYPSEWSPVISTTK